jgi:hypothetical protein
MDNLRNFWLGLTEWQRSLVLVILGGTLAILVLSILWSFIFYGTDYSGFGEYLRSWLE